MVITASERLDRQTTPGRTPSEPENRGQAPHVALIRFAGHLPERPADQHAVRHLDAKQPDDAATRRDVHHRGGRCGRRVRLPPLWLHRPAVTLCCAPCKDASHGQAELARAPNPDQKAHQGENV